jgi:hypothetical protein
VPREHLKEMMAFEADRMTGLVLTDENVRPELNVVLEEQNMRVANNPSSAADRADGCGALSQPSLRPAGDRLAARKSKSSIATMRWRSTGASTRRTTPSWSSPATSMPREVKADAERLTARSRRAPNCRRAGGRRSRCRRRRAP